MWHEEKYGSKKKNAKKQLREKPIQGASNVKRYKQRKRGGEREGKIDQIQSEEKERYINRHEPREKEKKDISIKIRR